MAIASEARTPDRRRASRRRVSVSDRDGVPVFSVGERAVWDAGDLARLAVAVERVAVERVAVERVAVERVAGQVSSQAEPRGRPTVAIDMAGVTSLPAGFWDRLCRWTERGFGVLLLDPEPEVRTMRWFVLSARPLAADGGRAFELNGIAGACELRGVFGRGRPTGAAARGGGDREMRPASGAAPACLPMR